MIIFIRSQLILSCDCTIIIYTDLLTLSYSQLCIDTISILYFCIYLVSYSYYLYLYLLCCSYDFYFFYFYTTSILLLLLLLVVLLLLLLLLLLYLYLYLPIYLQVPILQCNIDQRLTALPYFTPLILTHYHYHYYPYPSFYALLLSFWMLFRDELVFKTCISQRNYYQLGLLLLL